MVGKIHQLILDHGVNKTRTLTLDKVERQCVDAAFAVMSDEERELARFV